MKNHYILTLLGLLLTMSAFSTLKEKVKGRVRVDDPVVEQYRDSVRVTMTLHFDGVEIAPTDQLVLTPVFSDKQNNERVLPPVVLNGTRRDLIYRRSFSLMKEEPTDVIYKIIKTKHKPYTNTLQYSYQVYMEQWMKHASLLLEKNDCGCADSQQTETEIIANRITLLREPLYNYAYTPSVCFITPETEPIKLREEEGEANVIFTVGNATLVPTLRNNMEELHKIAHSLNYVKEAEGTSITAITISAYASPEGKFEHNRDLAERRAQALSNYVRRNFNVGSVPVKVGGSGEDWETLRQYIQQDTELTAQEVKDITAIIDDVLLPDIRESYLKRYNGGRVYAYLLKNYFPLLRRSQYRISFTVTPFTVEKGKEIIKKSPKMLSLNEFYHIANTYEQGSKEFAEVFSTAVSVFPNDKVANLNAGAALILSGEYEKAEKYIMPYKNDPDAWNNVGVILMHQRKLDEAENYFRRAETKRIEAATENLKIIPELREALEIYEEEMRYYRKYE